MDVIKIPYEISLWDDVRKVGGSGAGTSEKIFEEKKIAIIGASDSESPISAFEPVLTQKIDGTNSLTFSMFAKYYDTKDGQYKDNPFMIYMTNERRIKLRTQKGGEVKWYDFVIKEIKESSENYKFTYTASDYFINELSKSGYSLSFSEEEKNNMGSAQYLAEQVLAGTDWSVKENQEKLIQTIEEPLYALKLNKAIEAIKSIENTGITIDKDQIIYVYYSSVIGENNGFFQFIYDKENIYPVNQNDVVSEEYGYHTFDTSDLELSSATLTTLFRGYKLVRSPKTQFDKVLQKYVNVYENNVLGYTESKYITPKSVMNYIVKDKSFTSTTGWYQQKVEELEGTAVPDYDQVSYGTEITRKFDLQFTRSTTNQFLVNLGIPSKAAQIGTIAEGQEFIFRIRGGTYYSYTEAAGITGYTMPAGKIEIEVAPYKWNDDGTIARAEKEENDILLNGTITIDASENNKEFYKCEMKALQTLTVDDLNGKNGKQWGIFIKPEKNGTYYFEQIELFPYVLTEDETAYMLPDGSALQVEDDKEVEFEDLSYVKAVYYYFKNDQSYSAPEHIKYLHIGDRDDNYTQVYNEDYEKTRSITKKESNRFDLLQTISETFGCWCKFDIEHDVDGKIIKKSVSFQDEVGEKKEIGFTYGLNLKSIQRTLDSKDIATKLIVKNNNNKYATSGFCSIARAVDNPHGENFVHDFSHYINLGLINKDELLKDLYYDRHDGHVVLRVKNDSVPQIVTVDGKKVVVYDESKDYLGVYSTLRPLNQERDRLVLKQSQLIVNLSKAKSEDKTLQISATEEEYRDELEYFEKLVEFGYDEISKNSSSEKLQDEKVIATMVNIDRLKQEIKELKSEQENIQSALDEINLELGEITESLATIEATTKLIIDEFELKYRRYIQEASWTSEDYTDDNLYFIDAQSTLHKSAQPKVSYSINCVEISCLPEYKIFTFNLGDITYIQDPEFFGYDSTGAMYKEEIVVTELTTHLDSPEKNAIKVQNYRDNFEDLFQRLTASAQQLSLHQGEFQRAADVTNPQGGITSEALSNAFKNNSNTLQNVNNQSVTWDENGITTVDTTDPSGITRITSKGIFLSEDSGDSWTAGITPQGINAKVMTSGVLNTEQINIMNRNQTAFRWDELGINAFKENKVVELPPAQKESLLQQWNAQDLNNEWEKVQGDGSIELALEQNRLSLVARERSVYCYKTFDVQPGQTYTIECKYSDCSGRVGYCMIQSGRVYTEDGERIPEEVGGKENPYDWSNYIVHKINLNNLSHNIRQTLTVPEGVTQVKLEFGFHSRSGTDKDGTVCIEEVSVYIKENYVLYDDFYGSPDFTSRNKVVRDSQKWIYEGAPFFGNKFKIQSGRRVTSPKLKVEPLKKYCFGILGNSENNLYAIAKLVFQFYNENKEKIEVDNNEYEINLYQDPKVVNLYIQMPANCYYCDLSFEHNSDNYTVSEVGIYKGQPTYTAGGRSSDTFVRFDQYGLYGISGKANFNPDGLALGDPSGVFGIEKIKRDARFGITWDGFFLNNDENSVRISSDEDFVVRAGDVDRVKIGRIGKNTKEEWEYGIRLKNAKGDSIFETDENGNLSITGTITADQGTIGGWNIRGAGLFKIKDETKAVVIKSSGENAFAVYSHTISQDSQIFPDTANGWTIPFSIGYDGSIVATKGEIGGWTINESELKYGDDIFLCPEGGHEVSFDENTKELYVLGIGNFFKVSKYGALRALSGQIGSWYISGEGIISGNQAAWIFPYGKEGNVNGTLGDYVFYAKGNFGVALDGTLRATGAEISGSIIATTLSVGSGNNLLTYNNSKLTVKGQISATSGTIAGWSIDGNDLSTDYEKQGDTYKRVKLKPDGIFYQEVTEGIGGSSRTMDWGKLTQLPLNGYTGSFTVQEGTLTFSHGVLTSWVPR